MLRRYSRHRPGANGRVRVKVDGQLVPRKFRDRGRAMDYLERNGLSHASDNIRLFTESFGGPKPRTIR
jgi:hypothetical protein